MRNQKFNARMKWFSLKEKHVTQLFNVPAISQWNFNVFQSGNFTAWSNMFQFPDYSSGKSGQKFMRLLDKFTQSKYVQSAMDLKYIKKAMEGVSNTPIVLTVEVHFLSGELALNVPFPPTDRLWYEADLFILTLFKSLSANLQSFCWPFIVSTSRTILTSNDGLYFDEGNL